MKLLPPSAEHRRRVLKAVVLAAEQDGVINEEVIEMYTASLLNQAFDTDAVLPEPSPGWAYKIYSYAPAAEPLASTLQHLNALEQQVVDRCRRQQQQQQQQQQEQEMEEQQQQPEQEMEQLQVQEQVVVSTGDRRHGLLALRLSLNLLEGATGCHEWEAGFFMAEYVLSHPELVQGVFGGRPFRSKAALHHMRAFDMTCAACSSRAAPALHQVMPALGHCGSPATVKGLCCLVPAGLPL
jgi:hypothetical protein